MKISSKKLLGLSALSVMVAQSLLPSFTFADNLQASHIRHIPVWPTNTYSGYVVGNGDGTHLQNITGITENFFLPNSVIHKSEEKPWCSYVQWGKDKLYGWDTISSSCEPKYVNSPLYWTPNPFLIINDSGKGYNYNPKPAPNDSAFKNKVNLSGRFYSPVNSTKSVFTFLPEFDEIPMTNGAYNEHGATVLIRPSDWESINPTTANLVKQYKNIAYQLQPDSELNNLSKFRGVLARRNMVERLLHWDKLSANQVSLYWFPENEKWWDDKAPQYIYGTYGTANGCKHTYTGSNKSYGEWKKCINFSQKSTRDKPFRLSYYADVQSGISQINKGVYIRPNKLVKVVDLNKTNYGLHGFIAKNKTIRFAVVPEHTFAFKAGGNSGADAVNYLDVRTNYRPEIAFHLNFVAFQGKWAKAGSTFDSKNYLSCSPTLSPKICSQTLVPWGTVGRDRNAAAANRSLGKVKADYNGYVTGQHYSGLGYRLKGESVGKDAQLNGVYYSNAGSFPFESDNRYAYFLDIGYCGDGLIQRGFGEKCDWPNCTADCQKIVENSCGNGKIDKIGEYISKENKKVPIYEQCDPWMFENDNINKDIDTVGAGGKYTGINNPCYSTKEVEQAKKYWRTQCQWKVPEAEITVTKKDGNASEMPSEVTINNYPAWATPRDMRIFKYVFKKDTSDTGFDMQAESDKIRSMSYPDKLKYLAGINNNRLIHQSLIGETFNENLCKVINANEGGAAKVCGSSKVEPKDWPFNCHWMFGLVNPKYTAPYFTNLPNSWDKFNAWKSKPVFKAVSSIFPNGFNTIVTGSAKDNQPFTMYQLGFDPKLIGKTQVKATNFKENAVLLKANAGNFATGECVKAPHDSNLVSFKKTYYIDDTQSDLLANNIPNSIATGKDKLNYTIKPIYWAMVYNNVALAHGFPVFNIVSEFDGKLRVNPSANRCSAESIGIKSLGNGKVDINFSKAFSKINNKEGFNKEAICAWVKEEGKSPVDLFRNMSWFDTTFKLPSGEVMRLRCMTGKDYLAKSSQLKFQFQRNKKAGNTLLQGTASIINLVKMENGQWRPVSDICHASLNGGFSVEKCDIDNYTKGEEKPNPTNFQWGNIGNLIWVGAY